MHVLFVTDWWPSEESPVNGIFIKEHAEAISTNVQVTVLHVAAIEKGSGWKDFPYSIKKTTTPRHKNLHVIKAAIRIKIRRFGLLEWALDHAIKKIIDSFRKTRNPVDLVHLNVLPTTVPSRFLLKCEQFGLPVVLSEHSSFYHTEIYQLPEEQIQLRKKQLQYLLNKKCLKAIFPVSKELGTVLVKDYKAPSEKIKVIPNIANAVFCSTHLPQKVHSDELVVLAVAIWLPPKNPMLFFKMLQLLQQRDLPTYSRLRIIWGGQGELQEKAETFAKKELADLKIHFTGLLTKNKIASYMQTADFLVHPTDRENLPCIIIESHCAGLPVLSAEINGIVELIDQSNGLMYEPGNVEDLYEKFVSMIAKKTYFDREKIAAAARNKYSADIVQKNIVETYKAILT